MRGRLALVVVLWTGLAAGCQTEGKTGSTAWLPRFNPFQGPVGPDVVCLEVAPLEPPLGDPYINEELWQSADERLIEPEKKALMEESGFRIGQVGGLMTPPKFLALLISKRYCVNPRGLQVRAGQPTTLALGPTLPQCRFQVEQDGHPQEVEFQKADLKLSVVPSLTKEGTICLRFTPQVIHGDKVFRYRPAGDHFGWWPENQRPTENYAYLSWEATLAPTEYLVIGGRFDKTGTLGHQSFLRPDEVPPVQRLLVIRCAPLQRQPTVSTSASSDSPEEAGESVPLALQATWSSNRRTLP